MSLYAYYGEEILRAAQGGLMKNVIDYFWAPSTDIRCKMWAT
jgi:hypothetical protein